MANEMRDQLFELLTDCGIEYAQYLSEECDKAIKGDVTKQLFKRLEFYADHLIENGVVILPCRSGDYVKWDNGIDYKLKEVKGFVFNNSPEKHLRQRLILEDCQPIFSHEGILGYMPKAEAEQKLKEMRGGKE